MPQPIRDSSSKDCSQPICAIPRRDSDRLLSSSIPLIGNNTEKRQTTSFEQAKKEPSRKKAVITVACCHGSLCNSPSQHHTRHQYSVRYFDNEDRGEGLPCELRNWCNRADEGVLIAFEACVFLQTEDRTIPKDRLVENLQRRRCQPLSTHRREGY